MAMKLTEKKLDSELVFDGRLLKVYRDTVELENGSSALREIIHHPGGVAMLPLDGDGNVYLVRQFRYPYHRTVLEVPAGKLEYGEEPFPAAQRELSEEIGAEAAQWTDLGAVLPSPGYTDEVLHLYLAQGLTFGQVHPDEDEFLEIVKLPFAEAAAMARDGRLQDGKTVMALLRAWLMRKEG